MQERHKKLLQTKFMENLKHHWDRYESYFANSKGLKKKTASIDQEQFQAIQQSFQDLLAEESHDDTG